MVTLLARSVQRSRRLNAIKRFQRFLVVAALSVGIVFATPALAQSPKFEMWSKSQVKSHAKSQLKYYGWAKSQWGCLNQLWTNESNWRLKAKNKTPVKVLKGGKWVKVFAGGIPQLLNLSPNTPAPEQIHRGLIYVKARYGSPCKALSFWNKRFWY